MTRLQINRLALPAALVAAGLALLGGPASAGDTEEATFAGGCFWCIEAAFEKVDGVLTVTSGYTGGEVPDPTYKQVSSGTTGHTEAVRIIFDPSVVTYEELLDVFWRNIDPTAEDRQFCDVGSQYRSGIFYHDASQRAAAEASLAEITRAGKLPGKVATEIGPVTAFYTAEQYHQDFYKKNPSQYKNYRRSCGQDQRLRELWGEER
jgi:peptide-methionine (S)-S-oxide reductase